MQRRILSGTFVLSSNAIEDYYHRAVVVREMIKSEFASVFEKVDFLLTPTTPSSPFTIKQSKSVSNPVELYLNDVMTIPASLAGLPSISIPTSMNSDSTAPIALQIIGPYKKEEVVLKAGAALERQAHFERHIPNHVYEP